MTLAAGTRLDTFEIVAPLGAGGMGEVYRARDATLKRDVAIKVLPEYYSRDPERLRRFEQEAQATAALNHPNILSIFHVGQYDGSPFIVTELLQGETVRDRLRKGPMRLREALDFSTGIARGLSAAHDAGIVHRDLKPENIFLTKDSRVKILDFGLAKFDPAKSASADAATASFESQTSPGHVLGTVGYMSPEQVRGQTADTRSDIFAFGAILYEMLTGQRAFQKATTAETMSAILNEEPPPISQIELQIPPALQRVLLRCVDKSPAKRFQSASDLGFALEALTDSTPATISAAPRPTLGYSWIWKAAAACLIVLVALYFILSVAPAPLKLGRATQITNDGLDKFGLFTDGVRLYFNEQVGTEVKIVQVSTSGGESSVVPIDLRSTQIEDISSDGSELLIERREADVDGELWIQPLPSGAPRRIGNITASAGAWLPDGDRIAYIKKESELYVTRSDGTGNRKLLTKERLQKVVPSPDARRFSLDVWDTQRQNKSIWQVNNDGSDLRPLFPSAPGEEAESCCGTWMADGRQFVFLRYNDRSSDLWALPQCFQGLLPCKSQAVPLTNGPLAYTDFAPSKDGKKIFAIGEEKRAEMIRYDPQTRQFIRLLSGTSAVGLEFSNDGQWLTWVSYPDNTLWISRADGTQRRQLTFPPLTILAPRWSRDGKRIAFTTHKPGEHWKIYTIARDGGSPEPLLEEEHRQLIATWGPNDESIAIGRPNRETPMTIEILDLKTNKVSELPGSEDLWMPAWSPDGRYIAASSRDYSHVTLFDFATGRWRRLAEGTTAWPQFSHDSKYVYFEKFPKAIYRARVSDGKLQNVFDFGEIRPVYVPNWGLWFGLAADDSPLIMRDLGSHEIYAFDVVR